MKSHSLSRFVLATTAACCVVSSGASAQTIKWKGWSVLPHNGTTDAAVNPVVAGSQLLVFSKGIDDRLVYLMRYNGLGVGDAQWSEWVQVTHPAPEKKTVAEQLPLFGATKSDRSYYTDASVTTVPMNGPAGNMASGVMLFYKDLDGRVRTVDATEVEGGGLTDSAPLAMAANPGVRVFVRGRDNKVWANSATVTESGSNTTVDAWTGWSPLYEGDEGTTDVALAGTTISDGRVFLFAKGIDDHEVYSNVMTKRGWSGWEVVPGGMTTNVALSAVSGLDTADESLHYRSLHLFATRTDGKIFINTLRLVSPVKPQVVRQPGWSGWEEVSGLVTDSSPGAVSYQGFLWVFARAPGNSISWNQQIP